MRQQEQSDELAKQKHAERQLLSPYRRYKIRLRSLTASLQGTGSTEVLVSVEPLLQDELPEAAVSLGNT